MWFAKYRWVFLAATIVLLGFAYYKTYKGQKPGGPWSKCILHGTTILSLGMITYTLVFNT
jgi:hypothetical protein